MQSSHAQHVPLRYKIKLTCPVFLYTRLTPICFSTPSTLNDKAKITEIINTATHMEEFKENNKHQKDETLVVTHNTLEKHIIISFSGYIPGQPGCCKGDAEEKSTRGLYS